MNGFFRRFLPAFGNVRRSMFQSTGPKNRNDHGKTIRMIDYKEKVKPAIMFPRVLLCFYSNSLEESFHLVAR